MRYSQGDGVNGFAITAMGYRGTWNSTDQIPGAPWASGAIGRFGDIDATDGGESSRYSAAFEWQRARGTAATKVAAYGLAYDLDLFSNFTYFLDDPVNGDQFQQTDRRSVSGAKVSHRRMTTWGGRAVQNTLACSAARRHQPRRAVSHHRPTALRRRCERTRSSRPASARLRRTRREWTPWLRSWRACASTATGLASRPASR